MKKKVLKEDEYQVEGFIPIKRKKTSPNKTPSTKEDGKDNLS